MSGTAIINKRIIHYFPDEREQRLQYKLREPAKVKKPLWRPQPGSSPSGLVPWRAGDVHHEAGWKGSVVLSASSATAEMSGIFTGWARQLFYWDKHWFCVTSLLSNHGFSTSDCQNVSLLRGMGEASKMPQVLKIKTTNTESHSAWLRNCFSLKPVGKHLESTQGNKTNVQAKAVSPHWQSTHQKWDSPVQSLALRAGEAQSKTKAA